MEKRQGGLEHQDIKKTTKTTFNLFHRTTAEASMITKASGKREVLLNGHRLFECSKQQIIEEGTHENDMAKAVLQRQLRETAERGKVEVIKDPGFIQNRNHASWSLTRGAVEWIHNAGEAIENAIKTLEYERIAPMKAAMNDLVIYRDSEDVIIYSARVIKTDPQWGNHLVAGIWGRTLIWHGIDNIPSDYQARVQPENGDKQWYWAKCEIWRCEKRPDGGFINIQNH